MPADTALPFCDSVFIPSDDPSVCRRCGSQSMDGHYIPDDLTLDGASGLMVYLVVKCGVVQDVFSTRALAQECVDKHLLGHVSVQGYMVDESV